MRPVKGMTIPWLCVSCDKVYDLVALNLTQHTKLVKHIESPAHQDKLRQHRDRQIETEAPPIECPGFLLRDWPGVGLGTLVAAKQYI